jgi:hypothetical protein
VKLIELPGRKENRAASNPEAARRKEIVSDTSFLALGMRLGFG